MTKHALTIRGVAAAAAGVLGIAGYTMVGPPARADDGATYVFNASGSAVGMQVTLTDPGFPATDTPINSGGPTAEVNVDSLGGSLGYAALPDPGQFATTLPSLGAGLVAGGLAGLPPTTIPSPPSYPFFVTTDSTTNPKQAIGNGPYSVQSESRSLSGSASAAGGFQESAAGDVTYLTSLASVTREEDSIVASGTSRVQGLALGPVTIGEVLATATETLGPSGKASPSSVLQISGLKIGGLPVSITQDQLNLPGPSYPLPVNASMAEYLKGSGVTIRLVTAQATKKSVRAPALVLTMPASTPGASDGRTVTIVLGGSVATMEGGSSSPVSVLAVPDSSTGGVSAPAEGAGTGGVDAAPPAVLPPETVGQGPMSPAELIPSQSAITFQPVVGAGRPVRTAESFGVELMYLWVLLGALAVIGLGQLIQYRGVRQWNSGVG